jgi:hypothetical protein
MNYSGFEFDIAIGFCIGVTVVVRTVGMTEPGMDTETGFGVGTGFDMGTGLPELLLWW